MVILLKALVHVVWDGSLGVIFCISSSLKILIIQLFIYHWSALSVNVNCFKHSTRPWDDIDSPGNGKTAAGLAFSPWLLHFCYNSISSNTHPKQLSLLQNHRALLVFSLKCCKLEILVRIIIWKKFLCERYCLFFIHFVDSFWISFFEHSSCLVVLFFAIQIHRRSLQAKQDSFPLYFYLFTVHC